MTSIPVLVARGWSEEEKRAYRLADNQLAARADWDPDLLRSELQELGSANFDLGLIGFEPERLDDILNRLRSNGLTDPRVAADSDLKDARVLLKALDAQPTCFCPLPVGSEGPVVWLEAMETDQAERLAMFLTPIRSPFRDRKFVDSLLEGTDLPPMIK